MVDYKGSSGNWYWDAYWMRIETAIELIERLDDPRFKLIITGTATDDYHGAYLHELHRERRNRDRIALEEIAEVKRYEDD